MNEKKPHVVGELEAAGYRLPLYAYNRPKEIDTKEIPHVAVVVVGAGLAGLTFANDLATRGVRCLLLDEDDTVGVRGASSRGIAYATKTLEILGRIGAADSVMKKGVTWTVGKTLDLEDEINSIDLSLQTRSIYPPFVNIQQFYVEAAMVDCAYATGLDIRWKSKVVAAKVEDERVTLTVETPDGSYQVVADWVVDATGVNSPIRQWAGIEVSREQSPDNWCICDVRIKQPLPFERRTWLRAPFNHNLAVWNHPLPDKVWRLDYQIAPGTDISKIDATYADALVRKHYGDSVDYEIVWFGPWAYRNMVVEKLRSGRVFLIGDAAHAFSPAGGRGGNSGMQDAENLAWKLALVVRKQVPESFLETYDEERRAAALLNIQLTSESMRFISPPTPQERAQRDEILVQARTDPAARQKINTGRLSSPHIYTPSETVFNGGQSLADRPLRRGDGKNAHLCEHTGGPVAGLILDFCEDHASAEKLAAEVKKLGVPITYLRVCSKPQGEEVHADPDLLAEIGIESGRSVAVYVRPDGHVAAIAQRDAILAKSLKALHLA